MFYVYILRSINYKEQIYIGFTTDLMVRLEAHNTSGVRHTTKYKPWEIITHISFNNKKQALQFERYLKGGSGRAFANKHLL